MATRAERTALIFVSAVVFVGAAVRMTRALRHGDAPEPAAQRALAHQRQAVDSAAHARRPSRGGTPPRGSTGAKSGRASRVEPQRAHFPIDVDQATAQELEALPRVGPSLAARIIEAREKNGPFGSLDTLRARVKGIGPAMAKLLDSLVVFSGR